MVSSILLRLHKSLYILGSGFRENMNALTYCRQMDD